MTEDERAALVERVHGEVLAVYTDGHDHYVSDLYFHANRIIALIIADERKRIAAALLDDGAVEAAAYCGELFPGWAKDTMTKEHRDASIGHARQQVNAALAAAGITGAGQEGASNE